MVRGGVRQDGSVAARQDRVQVAHSSVQCEIDLLGTPPAKKTLEALSSKLDLIIKEEANAQSPCRRQGLLRKRCRPVFDACTSATAEMNATSRAIAYFSAGPTLIGSNLLVTLALRPAKTPSQVCCWRKHPSREMVDARRLIRLSYPCASSFGYDLHIGEVR